MFPGRLPLCHRGCTPFTKGNLQAHGPLERPKLEQFRDYKEDWSREQWDWKGWSYWTWRREWWESWSSSELIMGECQSVSFELEAVTWNAAGGTLRSYDMGRTLWYLGLLNRVNSWNIPVTVHIFVEEMVWLPSAGDKMVIKILLANCPHDGGGRKQTTNQQRGTMP